MLLAGLPRSGTSWIAHALGLTQETTLVSEPDNDRNHVEALKAKASLGRYPILVPGDEASDYAALWRHAAAGADHADGMRNRWAADRLAQVPAADIDRVMADPCRPVALRAPEGGRPGSARR